MDRAAALPDRCVICNEPAHSGRVKRKLYWTPTAWRVWTLAIVVVVIALGMWVLRPLLMAFWPLVIVLVVVNMFIRKSLKLELGICPRHRRRRNILRGLSVACLLLVGSSFSIIGVNPTAAYVTLFFSAVALLALAGVQAFVGVQAIRLTELSPSHAWPRASASRSAASFRN
ncbi:MAG: hypothetical protein QOD26_685 [Betaproteobacteria bacterium]|jgi:hypothetical protein|nr:hypothetical protein [Betaproteobacteria bacterium]